MAILHFSRLYAAMQQAAHVVQEHWQAMAERMLESRRVRDAYTRGIVQGPVEETPDGLSAVVSNTAPNAVVIEQGHGAYHLPSRINWERVPSARRSRRGRYYLIIPFRHYSAQRGSRAQEGSTTSRRQMLPRAVYHVAQRLKPGQYLTAGESRGQAVHAPGLVPYEPRLPQNVRPGYTHSAIHERLQRFPGARRGAGSYLTFRTLAEDSPGWWIPGEPPRPVAAQTVREVTPHVRRVIEAAAAADIRAHIQSKIRSEGNPSVN